MKKIILAVLFTAQIMTQAYAGGEIEVLETEVLEVESEESRFYVVVKALRSLGAEIEHGEATLDGAGGYGIGIDFGYRLGESFALEYDFSYAKNKVTEIIGNHAHEEVNAKYYTSSLDIAYTYEVTETLGIFAKVGYEYEWETIDALGIDSREHGFIAGVGFEMEINEQYKFLLEYEHSTIESPRGDSLYAGLMYNF